MHLLITAPYEYSFELKLLVKICKLGQLSLQTNKQNKQLNGTHCCLFILLSLNIFAYNSCELYSQHLFISLFVIQSNYLQTNANIKENNKNI